MGLFVRFRKIYATISTGQNLYFLRIVLYDFLLYYKGIFPLMTTLMAKKGLETLQIGTLNIWNIKPLFDPCNLFRIVISYNLCFYTGVLDVHSTKRWI